MNQPARETYAVESFLRLKAQIDAELARLVKSSADNFNALPDDIDWSSVGALAQILANLQECHL